jgi:hypothetical protein
MPALPSDLLPSDLLVVMLVLALAGVGLVAVAAAAAAMRWGQRYQRAEHSLRQHVIDNARLSLALGEIKLAAEAPAPSRETVAHIHGIAARALPLARKADQ